MKKAEHDTLTSKKNDILPTIRKELSKVSKPKAEAVRKRLLEELGVIL